MDAGNERLDYDAVWQEHYPSLYRYALRFTGDADAAEDVVQEAFVRLLDQDLPRAEVRPWLFVVAANLARDRARKRARHRKLLRGETVAGARPVPPEEWVERREQVERVRQALAAISERDRTLLLMREEGFRYREIAEAVDVQASSVGALVARALRRFCAAYEEITGTDASSD